MTGRWQALVSEDGFRNSFAVLQLKEALAYALYMATNTFLPNLVNAIVLFYGGSLVLVGRMSAGALVSFMLYQQSLAAAFQVLSWTALSWLSSQSCSCPTAGCNLVLMCHAVDGRRLQLVDRSSWSSGQSHGAHQPAACNQSSGQRQASIFCWKPLPGECYFCLPCSARDPGSARAEFHHLSRSGKLQDRCCLLLIALDLI